MLDLSTLGADEIAVVLRCMMRFGLDSAVSVAAWYVGQCDPNT